MNQDHNNNLLYINLLVYFHRENILMINIKIQIQGFTVFDKHFWIMASLLGFLKAAEESLELFKDHQRRIFSFRYASRF